MDSLPFAMEASEVAATVAPAAPTTCLRDIDESSLLATRVSSVEDVQQSSMGIVQMPLPRRVRSGSRHCGCHGFPGFPGAVGTFGCQRRTLSTARPSGSKAVTHSDHGIVKKGQEQPVDKQRAQTAHTTGPDGSVTREATRDRSWATPARQVSHATPDLSLIHI